MGIRKKTRSSLLLTGAIFTLGLSSSISGQTDAERVARFGTFLGPNKYALLVWQKTTRALENPDQYDTRNNEIKFMDTKDGVVSILKKNANACYLHPSFTRDGKFKVYHDKTNRTVRKMNVASKTDEVLATGAGSIGRTWQSSNGKQYVIVLKSANATDDAIVTVYRINVEDPADSVQIVTSNSDWQNNIYNIWRQQDGFAGNWIGLTGDEKYLVGGFPIYGYLGIYDLPNKRLKYQTQQSQPIRPMSECFIPNGCWISVSVDEPNHALYTDNLQGHRGFRIINMDQSLVRNVDVTDAMVPKNINGTVFDCLRWTVDRDYVTYGLLHGNGSGGKVYAGHPNPVLYRISDGKFAAVYDAVQTGEANMDVYFYPTSTTNISRRDLRDERQNHAYSRTVYDLRGRAVMTSAPAKTGILIGVSASGQTITSVRIQMR